MSRKPVGKRKIRDPVTKKRVRSPVRKRRIAYTGGGREKRSVGCEVSKAPWWLERLEKDGEVRRVQVHALRRQVKADGRFKMVKCWLVKEKNREGQWVIRLKGGITDREHLRAARHAGDCFFRLRLHGWTVHEGKLGEDPRNDYMWISGREIADALIDFGWL